MSQSHLPQEPKLCSLAEEIPWPVVLSLPPRYTRGGFFLERQMAKQTKPDRRLIEEFENFLSHNEPDEKKVLLELLRLLNTNRGFIAALERELRQEKTKR
jgi:hypothetical protein